MQGFKPVSFMNGVPLLLALAAGLIVVPDTHAAELYPARPIRLIVPSGAGGITDTLARIIAQQMTVNVAQQVVVDNRPGASGIVGSQIVAKAAPDGYTLLMVFPSHAVNPSLYSKMPYDTVNDFAPVTMVSAVSLVLIVNKQFAAKSIRELIAIAKTKPDGVNFGSVGRGSLGHLGGELFRSMSGARFTHVAYKGSPQVMSALISGEIDIYFIASAGTAATHLKAGRIRALGVSSRERLPSLPEVPPIAESLPGYDASGWNGILAPQGTPRRIIERLHREIVAIVRSPEFSRQLATEGALAVGNTPAEFDAVIRADVQKWAKVIKDAGMGRE